MSTQAHVTADDNADSRASVREAAGPLALEALLVADLRLEVESLRRDATRLGQPLRLVVPSQSLRDHLAALCVRQVSPSLAGISIQTLHGFALAVLERGGHALPRGAHLFETVVRRAVHGDPTLAAELDTTEIGPSAAAATLADFFDAGFVPSQAEALRDALGESGRARPGRLSEAPSRALVRARALVSALEETARDMEEHDIARPSAGLARAAEALREDGARSRSRAIWIYGFSDATGLALDLLEALRNRCAARIYVDLLATAADGHAPESAFGLRLAERLALPRRGATPAARVTFERFSAPGAQAEAREVAVRLRALLDRGTRPESIGVVARDLEPWRLALRHSFGRLAIPFSGISTRGAPSLVERRAQTLATLLQARGEIPIDRWLDVCSETVLRSDGPLDARPSVHDLSTACRALGCGRLARLAELDIGVRLGSRMRFVLPVHGPARQAEMDVDTAEGAAEAETDGEGDTLPRLERRTIARSVLEMLQGRARATVRHLEDWPEHARLERHAAHWTELVRQHLGWTEDHAGFDAFARALVGLTEDVPAEFELSGEEFARLARRALAEASASSLGGAGGGVQCLSLVEARARTFDQLFVIGLNQGHFPRTVTPDPLLSDELRRRLLPVLPDLPIKGAGRAEERFLFEQILRASASVTLSWQSVDDDGRPMSVSPFVQRLFADDVPLSSAEEAERAPPIFPHRLDPTARARGALRPIHEEALLAALRSPRARDARANLGRLLPAALREVRASGGLGPETRAQEAEIAAARIAIVSEIDAPARERPAPGPYFGFLGAATRAGDLRQADLWVTTLERMAGCPWQAFLERVLRIEPAPDPLALLPAVDARVVGIAVHAVLSAVADRAQRAAGARPDPEAANDRVDLARVLARPAVEITWPPPAELERLLLDVARQVLHDEGLVLPGLERVLIEALRAPLEVARALDEGERQDVRGVLGSESSGSILIAGGTRALSFKVDRIDRTATGPRLTDFKTGRPISDKSKPVTREKHFVRAVAAGTHLQAAAYALAGGADARGRYLFLRPELPPDLREFAIASGTNMFTAEFAHATETLVRAWQRGSFFPRLLEPNLEKEPRACQRCLVSSACLRGDSGARQRWASWVTDQAAGDGDVRGSIAEDASAEAAALELWHLGRKPEADAESESPDASRAESRT